MKRKNKKQYFRNKIDNPALQKIKQNNHVSFLTNDSEHTGDSFLDIPIDTTDSPDISDSQNIITGEMDEIVSTIVKKESEYHTNLSSPYIFITEDKAKLALNEYKSQYNINIINKNKAITFASVLFTLGTTFITTDFKNILIPKECWITIYIVFSLFSLFSLVFAFIKFKKNPEPKIDNLIIKLKNIKK